MQSQARTITSFQVVDHGVDGSQYFPGCGTAFTEFDYVQTGCGDTFAEAIEDALESMAQSNECDSVDFNALETAIKAEGFDGPVNGWIESLSAVDVARKANGHMSDQEWEEYLNECDVYYYVSIRYNVSE